MAISVFNHKDFDEAGIVTLVFRSCSEYDWLYAYCSDNNITISYSFFSGSQFYAGVGRAYMSRADVTMFLLSMPENSEFNS